jgi:hypothetical protein
MAHALDYKFDEAFIRQATYAPIAYLSADLEGSVVRQQVRELLDGKRVLHISTAPPVLQAALGPPAELPALGAPKPAVLPPGVSDPELPKTEHDSNPK